MSDTHNTMFLISTFAFTTFHYNWLQAFLLDSLFYFTIKALAGTYHPGGPRGEKLFGLYFETANNIFFMLPAIGFIRYAFT
jgi:hypothetical protein